MAFDKADPAHAAFIQAAAILKAQVCGCVWVCVFGVQWAGGGERGRLKWVGLGVLSWRQQGHAV